MWYQKIKIVSVFLIAVLLLFPIQIASSATLTSNEKIGSDLLERMEQVSEGKVPVYVWIQEPDFTELYQQVDEIMGEQIDYPGTDDEYLFEAEKLIQEMKAEVYVQYQREFLHKAGLSENDLVKESASAPVVIVWLDQEQIYRLAAMDQVCMLLYYEDDSNVTSEAIVFEYTALDALRILQACVGLTSWHFGPEYDVNQDGHVNALDALLALQSSVGLITISWPDDTAFLE